MPHVREFFTQRLILFLSAVFVASGLVFFGTPGSSWTWAAVLSGMASVIVVEYVTHRYLLHEFPHLIPSMYEGHVAHHERPNDIEHLFGAVRYDFFGYFLLAAATRLITGSAHQAAAYIFGAVLFQLYYQWKHFISHRPVVPLTPWGKWMKKKHLLHHYQDEHAWYGVSNPAFDILLGTDKPKAKAKRSDSNSFFGGH